MTEALEKQKHEQLEALRQQLLEKRRRSKKALHRTHLDEAQAMGFPTEVVPEIEIPSHEKLEHDLQALSQQQAKMIAVKNLESAKVLDEAFNNVSVRMFRLWMNRVERILIYRTKTISIKLFRMLHWHNWNQI